MSLQGLPPIPDPRFSNLSPLPKPQSPSASILTDCFPTKNNEAKKLDIKALPGLTQDAADPYAEKTLINTPKGSSSFDPAGGMSFPEKTPDPDGKGVNNVNPKSQDLGETAELPALPGLRPAGTLTPEQLKKALDDNQRLREQGILPRNFPLV